MKDLKKRKELAAAYKNSYRPMGIYQLRNIKNGKTLLGGSMNLDGIKNRSEFSLNMGIHNNKALQSDWKEYGEESFVFEILHLIKPQEEFTGRPDDLNKYIVELEELEKLWLEELQPYGDKGYNISH